MVRFNNIHLFTRTSAYKSPSVILSNKDTYCISYLLDLLQGTCYYIHIMYRVQIKKFVIRFIYYFLSSLPLLYFKNFYDFLRPSNSSFLSTYILKRDKIIKRTSRKFVCLYASMRVQVTFYAGLTLENLVQPFSWLLKCRRQCK
jgi:hypothetical protein